MYVWLAMVTGGPPRRALWYPVVPGRPGAAVLTVEKSQGQIGGQRWEKDTKTHQSRRLAFDPETVELLRVHIRC